MAEESEVLKPWERMPNEKSLWFKRFQEYLHLGPTRTLIAVYRAEAESARMKKRAQAREGARFNVPGAWLKAAKTWDWKRRADAFDDEQRRLQDAFYAARQQEILQSGFANRHTRIFELNRLAALLQQELGTEDKRWLPDVKQIGSGEDAERVDIVRFNAAMIEQYRQSLEDIAIEMGERERGVKLKGTITHVEVTSDDMAKAKRDALEWEQSNFGNE